MARAWCPISCPPESWGRVCGRRRPAAVFGPRTREAGPRATAGPQRRLLTCWSQSPVSSARSGHGLGHGALFVNTVLNICHLLGISAYGLVSLVPSFVIFLFPDFFALPLPHLRVVSWGGINPSCEIYTWNILVFYLQSPRFSFKSIYVLKYFPVK